MLRSLAAAITVGGRLPALPQSNSMRSGICCLVFLAILVELPARAPEMEDEDRILRGAFGLVRLRN
jgi:hypothetical protein